MVRQDPGRFVTVVLLIISLVGGTAVQAAGTVRALPAGDIVPPEIVHTPLEEFPAGLPLRIQARVTDESGVADVTLFYRAEGDSEYRRVTMRKAPGSNLYSADLPARAGPRIEYFIQASDEAGNTVLGRLFDPYLLTVLPEAPAAPETPAVAATESMQAAPAGVPGRSERARTASAALAAAADEGSSERGISRWVWVGLGVVAIAALAGAAGGGGGGGEPDPAVPPAGTAGTGTVTITAPVP